MERPKPTITEAQRAFLQAEHLASLSTLAAGVAHEVNNPLAFIVANLHYLVEELTAELSLPPLRKAELLEVVRESLSGAERVRRIVHDLKGLWAGPDPVDSLVTLPAPPREQQLHTSSG